MFLEFGKIQEKSELRDIRLGPREGRIIEPLVTFKGLWACFRQEVVPDIHLSNTVGKPRNGTVFVKFEYLSGILAVKGDVRATGDC